MKAEQLSCLSLLTADTVKAAFVVLEEAMKESEAWFPTEKIILATVQGDIHNIWKEHRESPSENYGYEIIDLGKRCSH